MSQLFDFDRLLSLARASAGSYQAAQPFPHAVMDGVLDATALRAAAAEFPRRDQISWYQYDNPFERKLATNRLEQLAVELRDVLTALNSAAFVEFIETLTGIPDLVADPEFVGGGLHLIEPGGKLDIHADFNRHPVTRLHRRVNTLLFLNDQWQPHYGGDLEFWDPQLTGPVQRIAPTFNRLVVFTVNDVAYHGHPDPLTCPEDVARKSLAVYYYTHTRPTVEESAPHSTLYQRRPGEVLDPATEELRSRRAVQRLRDCQTEAPPREKEGAGSPARHP
jgi:Rps23 Pro-64 3,4-dihydroxylase Tpa1-like proline 4-hydroxylase